MNTKIMQKIIIFLMLFTALFSLAATVNAQPAMMTAGPGGGIGGGNTPPLGGGNTPPAVSGGGSAVELSNPLNNEGSLEKTVNNIITSVLGITGVLALLAFIYGGVLWMISYGDTAKIQKGRTTMIWAVAGLLIIFSAYAIINLVFDALGVQ